jgi:ERCC4-type nuclease
MQEHFDDKIVDSVEPSIKERRKIVDSREPEELRTKLLMTGWQQGRLTSGDFYFQAVDYRNIGVTRKTVPDLLSSMNKIFGLQLQEMLERYSIVVLIVEGRWDIRDGHFFIEGSGEGRGLRPQTDVEVNNFLRTWQDRSMTIERTISIDKTAKRLNELFAYYMKENHSGGIKRQTVGDPRLLAFGEGIGVKIGKLLLEYFGSLKAVANAEIEQYRQVEGIGQKRAESLWYHFNKDGKNEQDSNALPPV